MSAPLYFALVDCYQEGLKDQVRSLFLSTSYAVTILHFLIIDG